MQVGDLVRWETMGGEFEYGIVTSFDTYNKHNGVMVYFFDDDGFSEITKDDLVVVNESR